MIVSISESYDDDFNKKHHVLITAGCGCCASADPATIENIDEAIAEHEEFIKQLKELRCTVQTAQTKSTPNEQP